VVDTQTPSRAPDCGAQGGEDQSHSRSGAQKRGVQWPAQPCTSLRMAGMRAKAGAVAASSMWEIGGRRGVLAKSADCARGMGRRARDAGSARLSPDRVPGEAWCPLIRVRRGEGVQKVHRDVSVKVIERFRAQVLERAAWRAMRLHAGSAGRSGCRRGPSEDRLHRIHMGGGHGLAFLRIFIRDCGGNFRLRFSTG
jgi:hypothetical protein